jgi:hypothetical protein
LEWRRISTTAKALRGTEPRKMASFIGWLKVGTRSWFIKA